jgi:PAS domain S-box-containing protein
MKKKPLFPLAPSPLRSGAEKRRRAAAKTTPARVGRHRPTTDPVRLLHELQVHQIELEMQNEELRAARDEMEAGLEKYSELYDFAPVGYLTLNRAGAIREANLTGAALLGVPRSPLLKQRLVDFVVAADRLRFTAFLQKVFAGQDRQECDMQILDKKQGPVDVRIRATVFESGAACRVSMSDISLHQQAERKLRVSEIRYRRLFETAHDGVLLLDPVTRKITDANPFMTKLLGYPLGQLVGKELFEIGLLKDEAASKVMFRNLTLKHEVRYEDLPLESAGGHHQEVEVVANLYQESGQAVIQCNIRDITARKRSEEALRAAQVQLVRYASELERQVGQRTAELVTANRELTASLASTRLSEEQNRVLLLESVALQKKFRALTHQIITAQEEERKKISRELHDVVVQTLVGINVELAALGGAPGLTNPPLLKKLGRTQRMVAKSVQAVHQFARELRPAVLDDLGLIPALHSHLKLVAVQHQLQIKLKAFAGVEQLAGDHRTVLYRVAQEALTNVVRHARATAVTVSLSQRPGILRLEVQDNGQSFAVAPMLSAKTNKRLGLLGMRERMEMIGGSLVILSAPGRGTTVRAELPFQRGKAK